MSHNSAKYKDYVIYNTPSGNPDLSGVKVKVHGDMVDSVSGQPLTGGKVILEYVDAPVIVGPDGKWSADNVPIECTKMWGMALAHVTFYKEIVLTADGDNVYEIQMVPGGDNPPPPNT